MPAINEVRAEGGREVSRSNIKPYWHFAFVPNGKGGLNNLATCIKCGDVCKEVIALSADDPLCKKGYS